MQVISFFQSFLNRLVTLNSDFINANSSNVMD
jgi:hypothetical protein